MNAVAPPPVGEPATPAGTPPPDPPRTRRARGPLLFLAVLAALFACWAARDLLIPVMLAAFFAVIGGPVVSRLRRLWVPRWIGAAALVAGGLALTVLLAAQLAAPAAEWVRDAPRELRQEIPKLRELVKPVEEANRAAASLAQQAAGPARDGYTVRVIERRADLWDMLARTPRFLAGLLAVVLLSYFFLVYGEDLQRRAIALLPARQHQRVTVGILQDIERDVTRYVVTITLINTLVAAVLTGALIWLGLDFSDALLWGVVAGLLNYAPFVGPLIGVIAYAVVGLVSFEDPARALLLPALYLGLHTLESQLITPIVLGRRLAISPLVLLLWLMLWGFLWGIAGLLLAVPMLVCFKLAAARIPGWEGWAKVME